MTTQRIPVLIVGSGPVGLSLSIDLSWRGVRHMLIDRGSRADRADHPRMDQVGIRSMEHFRRLGIVADVEASGFPRNLRRDCVFATSVLGAELAREPFEADATRSTPPFSPQKHELCPQNFLDPVLQAVAERSPFVDIRYATQLTTLSEAESGVTCTLLSTDGAAVIDADFVAGCDGSGSTVATAIQAHNSQQTMLACSTNIFIDAPGLRQRAAEPGAYRYILVGPEGVWASMVNINGRDNWRLQVLGDAERPHWTDFQARALVDQAIGVTFDYRITSIVPWLRREVVADCFASRRCFLVGDAAHQFSPTGGYGMNTGLSDAFNLSWKLAAVLEGWGGSSLLSSYDAERRPVATRNASRATVNFERMRERSPAQNAGSGSLDVLGQAGQALRVRMAEEWDSMGIHLGYSYGGSPVISDQGDPLPHSGPVEYRQTARPGARAPHVWLEDGRSTLDLFGHGFTLLRFAGDPAPLLEAARKAGVPLRLEQISEAGAHCTYGVGMVLVRPDGHVAWAGDTTPYDPDLIITRVVGGLPCGTGIRHAGDMAEPV